jgi:hypothetical protein
MATTKPLKPRPVSAASKLSPALAVCRGSFGDAETAAEIEGS